MRDLLSQRERVELITLYLMINITSVSHTDCYAITKNVQPNKFLRLIYSGKTEINGAERTVLMYPFVKSVSNLAAVWMLHSPGMCNKCDLSVMRSTTLFTAVATRLQLISYHLGSVIYVYKYSLYTSLNEFL